MELDRFIVERITKPLGLIDTGFGPIDEARTAQPQVDPASGKRPPMRNTAIRPNWISGGSALLSTAGNYVRFCQMLLNGPGLGGTRLLSPTAVALMTSDHLQSLNAPQPVDPDLVWCSGANAGTWARLRPRLRGAYPYRSQSVTGLGR